MSRTTRARGKVEPCLGGELLFVEVNQVVEFMEVAKARWAASKALTSVGKAWRVVGARVQVGLRLVHGFAAGWSLFAQGSPGFSAWIVAERWRTVVGLLVNCCQVLGCKEVGWRRKVRVLMGEAGQGLKGELGGKKRSFFILPFSELIAWRWGRELFP